MRMNSFLFHNGRLFDPRCDELVGGIELLVEGERVKEVSKPDGPDRGPISSRPVGHRPAGCRESGVDPSST
jgi:hypothetical protein